jgi:hypothetical protein
MWVFGPCPCSLLCAHRTWSCCACSMPAPCHCTATKASLGPRPDRGLGASEATASAGCFSRRSISVDGGENISCMMFKYSFFLSKMSVELSWLISRLQKKKWTHFSMLHTYAFQLMEEIVFRVVVNHPPPTDLHSRRPDLLPAGLAPPAAVEKISCVFFLRLIPGYRFRT